MSCVRSTVRFLCLAAALLAPAIRASAEDAPPFLLAWGRLGVTKGYLTGPRALAVEPAGTILVADASGRLQRFSDDGKILEEWGSADDLGRLFRDPTDLELDGKGGFYAADGILIRRYDLKGDSVARWGARRPSGLAIDKAGNIWCTDTHGQQVTQYDPAGTMVTRWGKAGSGDGELQSPAGLALDAKGNLVVADAGNHRIQKFDRTGKWLAKFGGPGTGPGQFDTPAGVAIDTGGNIYVVDSKNDRVQKFSADGTFLAQWGSAGESDGQFHSPTGIAVDKVGNVYVADTGNHRIQKFGPRVAAPAAPRAAAPKVR